MYWKSRRGEFRKNLYEKPIPASSLRETTPNTRITGTNDNYMSMARTILTLVGHVAETWTTVKIAPSAAKILQSCSSPSRYRMVVVSKPRPGYPGMTWTQHSDSFRKRSIAHTRSSPGYSLLLRTTSQRPY